MGRKSSTEDPGGAGPHRLIGPDNAGGKGKHGSHMNRCRHRMRTHGDHTFLPREEGQDVGVGSWVGSAY